MFRRLLRTFAIVLALVPTVIGPGLRAFHSDETCSCHAMRPLITDRNAHRTPSNDGLSTQNCRTHGCHGRDLPQKVRAEQVPSRAQSPPSTFAACPLLGPSQTNTAQNACSVCRCLISLKSLSLATHEVASGRFATEPLTIRLRSDCRIARISSSITLRGPPSLSSI